MFRPLLQVRKPLKHATFMNTSIRCRRAEVQALLPADVGLSGSDRRLPGRDDTHQSAGTHVPGSPRRSAPAPVVGGRGAAWLSTFY